MNTTMILRFVIKKEDHEINVEIPIKNKNELLRRMGFFVHRNFHLLFREVVLSGQLNKEVSNDLDVRFDGVEIISDLTQDHTLLIEVKQKINSTIFDFEGYRLEAEAKNLIH